MPLPVLTTADDIREIVRYLKNKPTGATLAEAKAAVKKQVLDARKLTAYQQWGFVSKEGDRFKLSPRGWELARKPETEPQIFRGVLDSIPPYRSVLEWVHQQNMDAVSNIDVAAHWHEHHAEALGTDNENTIKDNAVCFFHLCQAAGLGELTIGRRGQPTRLVLGRQELRSYIEAGPSAPPWAAVTEAPASVEPQMDVGVIRGTETAEATPTPAPSVGAPSKLRVFISHGKNTEIVEQVQTMLGLADIESEVAEKEETAAIPVPDKVFNAMRRCQAGIIAVTVEEKRRDDKGNYVLNENVLIEIGAAFVLYDRRVVLLWDKRLSVPSNLQGLYRCEFEGNELTWGAGMKLMKAIQGFKKPSPATAN
jgi:hypothetical protein